MENILDVLILSVFLETMIETLKPLWKREGTNLSTAQAISLALGVLIAVLGQINLLSGILTSENVPFQYICYVMTGIAIGRGPSFIHNLWHKLEKAKAELMEGEGGEVMQEEG